MPNKKQMYGIVTAVSLLTLSTLAEAVVPSRQNTQNQANRPVVSSPAQQNNQSRQPDQRQIDARTQERYDRMRRDEIDDTDALAIPFDTSEVEDEEEINRLEKKNVFDIPSSP